MTWELRKLKYSVWVAGALLAACSSDGSGVWQPRDSVGGGTNAGESGTANAGDAGNDSNGIAGNGENGGASGSSHVGGAGGGTAGTAGDAGAAGQECGDSCRQLPCASRGPCFSVSRNDAGECLYQQLDNDTPCDDADACTGNDSCQAGACVGEQRTATAAVRGQLASFGASPRSEQRLNWIEGGAAFLSDTRLVFLESFGITQGRLHLVDVNGETLTRVAEAPTDIPYTTELKATGLLDHWFRPTSFVVPLSASRVAVVRSERLANGTNGIEVFDIDGATLKSRGVTALPADFASGITTNGVAGRGDLLWVCAMTNRTSTIRSYALQSKEGGNLAFTETARKDGGAGGCNDLALSADGNKLFAAARGGIRVFDVSNSNGLTELAPIVLKNRYVENVQASGQYLVALGAQLDVESTGVGVIVMRASDFTEVATLQPENRSAPYPFGIGLTDNRLFIQWRESGASAGSPPSFKVSLHNLDQAGTPAVSNFAMREGCCGGEFFGPAAMVARGDLAVLQPWRRVVRFDERASWLQPITGLHHGSFGTVLPTGTNTVLALGPYSSHKIDISDPDAPRVLAGGMNLPPSVADFHFVVSTPGAAPQFATPRPRWLSEVRHRTTREQFSLLDTSRFPVQVTSSFSMQAPVEVDYNTNVILGAGAGLLHQVTYNQEAKTLQIRRFLPAQGLPFDPAPLMVNLGALDKSFGVDAISVAESGQELAVVAAPYLLWLSATPDSMSLVAQAKLNTIGDSAYAFDVAIAGDQALLVSDSWVARARRDGTNLVREAFQKRTNGTHWRLLNFDGKRATLAVTGGVEVLDALTLSTIASYKTPERVQTMAVAGTQLVFGMDNAIAIADPQCGP